MKFNGQILQDKFVINILKHKKNGYFLEIGCYLPLWINNTYTLEKEYNWKGISIDIDKEIIPFWKEKKRNSKLIIKDSIEIDYIKILNENNFPKNIDYLQIDLEVSNKSTLNTLEKLNKTIMNNYKFAVITFEHDIYRGDFHNTRNISRDILNNRGYILLFPDVKSYENNNGQFEDWWVHPDLIDNNLIKNLVTNHSLHFDKIILEIEENNNLIHNLIPNNIYFIFGFDKNEEFHFCYFMSVFSAYIINDPDNIYFYYHYEPIGEYWDKLKHIPCITFIKIDIPEYIGQKKLLKTAHKADILRMDLLYKYGGIYMDIDTISIKPYKKLLNNDVVLGRQVFGICNAIMMSKPKSLFFKLWLYNYEKNFNPNGWNEASIHLPEKLYNENKNLVNLQDEDVFFKPNFREVNEIFKTKNNIIPENLVTLHLWNKISLTYIKEIKNFNWVHNNIDTLYGKILINLHIIFKKNKNKNNEYFNNLFN